MEKSLPRAVEQQARQPAHRRWAARVLPALAILTVCAVSQFSANGIIGFKDRLLHHGSHAHAISKHVCAQPEPLFPPETDNDYLQQMYAYLDTPSFRNISIIMHSGAVKIPTQSYDDMGPIGEDKRWNTRYEFADYLKATFPRIHVDLKTEKVNSFGLLYTWQGSDETLKPLVLMAHQDVVPVPDSTVGAWTHPPFSGFYDGTFIWGRGSSDCKNQLIAIMETIEFLLDALFQPKRTIIMSFGFDEEISGREGAGHLSTVLHERYGDDGIAAIVDEGAGFTRSWGQVFAIPGVGEKGYTDVHITIRMPGGHSSIPVDHTSIGVMSQLITEIESTQYPTYLADNNPMLGLLQCGASHAPDFPKSLKKLLGKHKKYRPNACKSKKDELAIEAAKMGGSVQYLMQTSQAVDVIEGGAKINALPERTSATVNHRINIGDTPEMVWKRLTELAKPIAKKHNITLHAFDGVKEEDSSISLYPSDTTLQVAPVTPTEVDAITPYAILAGTTRAVYGEGVVVSPGITTGNTDTRYYWKLTKNIFRYSPGWDPEWDKGLGNIHTVDEHISVKNHIGMVKWFTLFVRNMDVAELE